MGTAQPALEFGFKFPRHSLVDLSQVIGLADVLDQVIQFNRLILMVVNEFKGVLYNG